MREKERKVLFDAINDEQQPVLINLALVSRMYESLTVEGLVRSFFVSEVSQCV